MYEKTNGKRNDGRAYDETRKVEAKIGVVKRANGSAMFSFGGSKAIAAVYGPRKFHPQHNQNPQKAVLRCHYDLASFSVSERKRPGASRRSSEVSYVIAKALEPVLNLEAFPNSVIDLFILITDADASTRVAGINAASMALADAGLEMKELVSAVSIGKIGDAIVADITKDEEDYCIMVGGEEVKAATDIPISILSRSEKIGLLQLDGKIVPEDLKEAITLAKKVCRKITDIQTKTLKAVKGDN